ncbi:MAG: NADH-quinone oxidoreductase subunit J [Pseudomonadota bacterium]|nr:NADH-quinone oxidoreductase subunit J [Pseudomonadota bacterium]MDP1903798.1 NADH-quinone oxidoreductase subunit J [Pseudomonadota bacterium]MDP2353739.1 NADH-quinone oxidoreductase subunit J [Pseudomonadota bacterium]
MEFKSLVFYVFSGILLLASLRVITARNPVHSALALVLAFFTAAGLWLLLEAEFLAITLVLVYIGAVMVLFLFVVMMLDINLTELRKGFWNYLPAGLLVAGLMIIEMVMVLGGADLGLTEPPPLPADYSNTKELGRLLYTVYVYPFELAAVVLLVAMIAAIALTHRKRGDTKRLNPAEQVKVKRADRIYMVNIKSQKPEAPKEDE